ncbi:MAG TPA: hypothetical protein VF026_05225 [Ktedonobacteraceae bacterium]
MKLPPVWASKSTTPVKAKTSAPTPDRHTSCAALTRRGLVEATPTGSRERGGGRRQTLERQARQEDQLTVGTKDATGTAWATPLGRTPPTLASSLAALRTSQWAHPAGVSSTQAACCRGA